MRVRIKMQNTLGARFKDIQSCYSSGPGQKLCPFRTDSYFPLYMMKIASENKASFVFVCSVIKVMPIE